MKKFKEISIWSPSGDKILDTIDIKIIEDDLKDRMVITYDIGYCVKDTITIRDVSEEDKKDDISFGIERFVSVYDGNITIDGESYQKLGGENMNEDIYNIVADKLKIKLI